MSAWKISFQCLFGNTKLVFSYFMFFFHFCFLARKKKHTAETAEREEKKYIKLVWLVPTYTTEMCDNIIFFTVLWVWICLSYDERAVCWIVVLFFGGFCVYFGFVLAVLRLARSRTHKSVCCVNSFNKQK